MTTIEKIRSEVLRYRNKSAEEHGVGFLESDKAKTFTNGGVAWVCERLIAFLDTLEETPTWVNRAEQRRKDQANGKKFAIMEIKAEIERRNLANYCGTAEQYEEELFAILDTLSEQEPEQPVEGLEEKIKRYLREECSGDDEPSVSDIARHFYELGCRRTAEKYDEIEYNRQRAEEAELSEDLKEELKRYINSEEYINTRESAHLLIARHFAEWGAEHLKTIAR